MGESSPKDRPSCPAAHTYTYISLSLARSSRSVRHPLTINQIFSPLTGMAEARLKRTSVPFHGAIRRLGESFGRKARYEARGERSPRRVRGISRAPAIVRANNAARLSTLLRARVKLFSVRRARGSLYACS